ncbi:SDR family NAD(P)-dependent oxidoreductase [Qipengyuania zhejiangensis]|uniref:SDR family NAD(P)-dependent oxidoreductase n=1 Tax=Qipengyuania zhejiangensis TaxID=3077782 RepID=UPI002D77FE66|nr:SDR family NAD(P)-dependent oxidoreductase [Qipengyuania sp. Z2]
MSGSFEGKVAIVTGASSGIGYATATLLAERGASVVLAARREEEIAAHADAIRAAGGKATHIRTDVSVSDDVQAMVAHAVATFGKLDIAVNNAGVEGDIGMIVDMPDENWDRVCGINLRGNFLCLKYEARAMLAAGNGGAIVNVGSVNSFLGSPGAAAYVASKHGQVGLTSSASAELAPQGIRVNIVCPGLVKTPMHQRIRNAIGDAAVDESMIPRVHQRRAGEPEEIAKTIAFLCSDDASYFSGSALTPDGGLLTTV